MPGRHCAVAACKNSHMKTKLTGNHIIYHEFPSGKDFDSQQTRKEWIRLCGRDYKWIPSHSQICSVHFTENDYQRDLQHELLNLPPRKRLKKTAVPSLHLDPLEDSCSTLDIKQEKQDSLSKHKWPEFATIFLPTEDFQPPSIDEEINNDWEKKYGELNNSFINLQKEKDNMLKEIKRLKLQVQSYKNKYQYLLRTHKKKQLKTCVVDIGKL